MSYYAELDNMQKSGGDVATTSGWGDFSRWVKTLDDVPELTHLATFGWSQELDALEQELDAAIQSGGRESVISTAQGLATMLRSRGDAEVIVVTDGTGVEANGQAA